MIVLIGALAACVGDDPGTSSPTNGDGGPGPGPGPGGADGSTPGDDGGQPQCTPGAKTCVDGTTLSTCGDPAPIKCALECVTTGEPHCTEIQPALPVVTADLTKPNVTALVITADGFVDTATGAIDNVRAPNVDPATEETKSGIGFRRVGNVGVFTVKSFRVESGATLKLRGAAAFAIAAAERIEIIGVVDARGYDAAGVLCGTPNTTIGSDTSHVAGPGGSPGGQRNGASNGLAPGAGGGKGVAAFTSGATAGPGGGGFGGAGGNGGNYAASGGAVVPFPGPIAGGFGGGASGGAGGANGANGGGGGGAVQLVAGISIEIGGGANPGGVNAGGCGGTSAGMGETGSAGGSGGAILLQAPVASVKANGVLAANGGGGGTSGGFVRAEHGKLSAMFAIGNAGNGSTYGKGGDGGPRNPGGSTPEQMLAGESGGTGTTKGGAGGGGVGRIRVENRSGSLSVDPNGIVSPVIATGATAATTVGVLPVK